MQYLSTTSNGILLKYLHVKSSGRSKIPLSEIVEDFKRIENSSTEVKIYDFLETDPRNNPQLKDDLQMLKAFKFVEYDFENPHVGITELGKLFAEVFRLPISIEQHLST